MVLAFSMKRFRCSPEQLELIASPAAYLQTLQALTAGARRRVFLSALYLGTDAQSRSLVGSCGEALRAGAEVRLLLDRGRATRPGASSLEALAPLLAGEQRGKAARVHLWESPAAAGSPLRGLPRWGELAGVFHGKAQVADGAVLLSGANLSQSYFTDRRDRYLLLHSPEVADFFFGLLETLAAFAGEAGSGERPRRGTAEMRAAVERLFAAEEGEEEEKEGSDSQHVTVRPTCQLGCAGISIDERIVGGFLEGLPEGGELWLASGYFNLTSAHEALLFRLADRLQVSAGAAPCSPCWQTARAGERAGERSGGQRVARQPRAQPPRAERLLGARGPLPAPRPAWHPPLRVEQR